MNIEQLKYFIQAVESGSVNSAAPKFYLTPQAMNASLRRLEKEFGSELLERNKKGLQLTPQGALFMEYAQRVLNQYEQMQIYLQEYGAKKENVAGTLSVYTSSVFTEQFLPTQISKFMQVYPEALVKIVMADAKNILSLFQQGYSRVALLTISSEIIDEYLKMNKELSLHWIPLLEDEIVLCAQNNHPLMRENLITIKCLEDYVGEHSSKISFYHVLTGTTLGTTYPKVVCDSNTIEMHKNLISDHGVITCMPKLAYHYQFQHDKFAAVPVEMRSSVMHGILYREDLQNDGSILINTFVQSLQRHFQLRYGEYKFR